MSLVIVVGGQVLSGWTDASATRSRSDLTGRARITVFMDWFPDAPPLGAAVGGADVSIYTGDHLFFTGNVDRRDDSAGMSVSIGPREYRTTIECRGIAGRLVDSAQPLVPHTQKNTSAISLARLLTEPYGVFLDVRAIDVPVPVWRFRSGARVVDELQRISESTGLFFRESETGALIVEDGTVPGEVGETLVLGQNILRFSMTVASDREREIVSSVGQRVVPEIWGRQAILGTVRNMVEDSVPLVGYGLATLYGDADISTLERRAYYEIARRAASARTVTATMFGVVQSSGAPWVVGGRHYVHAPQAGLQALLEVESVTVSASARGTLQTELKLTPPSVPRTGSADGRGAADSDAAAENTPEEGAEGSPGGYMSGVDPRALEEVLRRIRERILNGPNAQSDPPLTGGTP